MNVHLDQSTLVLGECDVLSLTDALDAVITARSGSVWITQELDTTDYIVRAGEHFRITRPGRTVLQAFGEAEVCVWTAGAAARDTMSGARNSARAVPTPFSTSLPTMASTITT